jgi:aminopeptidase N
MREGSATLIHRADYSEPAYRIVEAELVFDLDPAKTIVSSRLQIVRAPGTTPTPLRLHGEGLTLLRVLADGESVSFRHDGGELVIDQPPAADRFVLELRNTCAPERNTSLSGLYTSNGGFFTQCEAEGFRRITYFLDRPDVMAVYTVTLRAAQDAYPVLLSNGNLVEQGPLEGGRHFAKWHDPFPKPSYLFALVAGRLVCHEQRIRARSGREHLLQIYVRPGDLAKTEQAMRSLVAAIAWDEAKFGLPLDLDRFMIVAVEDFNMGAMENKGLNIFNTKAVLASPATATDADFGNVESVVAHEYFHNWTGNRVTCRDWFQLSLKEGLTVFRDQQFSMDMAGSGSARLVKRIEDVRGLRGRQFTEDAGAMAHPVRPDSYAAIDNFYTPTVYEKGAEVVRMMHTLVGEEGFRKGMALYFERHDGQAVTCDDFAAAIADANPASVLAAQLPSFKRWYSQAGTPRLRARIHRDEASGHHVLTLTQSSLPSPGQPGKQPFVIPVRVALLGRDGHALPLQIAGDAEAPAAERLLVLTQAEQSWIFTGLASEPVPALLAGFSAPVILDDGLGDEDRLLLLRHAPDGFVRWEAGQQFALSRMLVAVREGTVPELDDTWLGTLRAIVGDAALDPALKELLLTLPSESYLAEQLEVVDPQRIHAVREALVGQMAAQMHAEWVSCWQANQVREGYAPTPAQSGQRALAGLALRMLCRHAVATADPVWPGRAYQIVKDAGNLTERQSALWALISAHSPLAEPALAHFHASAKADPLVLDKWFSLQALAPELVGDGAGRVLARIRVLTQHPSFSLRNPNRARALLSTLFMSNPAAFHRGDAAGYVFFADKLLEVDALNAKLAARLARAMDRWPALAEPYRGAAREALSRVAARTDLSKDLREVVERALEAGA